jgi:hypothetical protein
LLLSNPEHSSPVTDTIFPFWLSSWSKLLINLPFSVFAHQNLSLSSSRGWSSFHINFCKIWSGYDTRLLPWPTKDPSAYSLSLSALLSRQNTDQKVTL